MMKQMRSIKQTLIILVAGLLAVTVFSAGILEYWITNRVVVSGDEENKTQSIIELGKHCEEYFNSAQQLLESFSMDKIWQEMSNTLLTSSDYQVRQNSRKIYQRLYYLRLSQEFFSTLVLRNPEYMVYSSEFTEHYLAEISENMEQASSVDILMDSFPGVAQNFFPRDWEEIPQSTLLSVKINREMEIQGILNISSQLKSMLDGYAIYGHDYAVLYNGMEELLETDQLTQALKAGQEEIEGWKIIKYEEANQRFFLVTVLQKYPQVSSGGKMLGPLAALATLLFGWGILLSRSLRSTFAEIEKLHRVVSDAAEKENWESKAMLPQRKRSLHAKIVTVLSLNLIPLTAIVMTMMMTFSATVVDNSRENWEKTTRQHIGQTEYSLYNDLQFMRQVSRNIDVLNYLAGNSDEEELSYNLWTRAAFSGNIVNIRLYDDQWNLLKNEGLDNSPMLENQKSKSERDFRQVNTFATGMNDTDLKMVISILNPLLEADSENMDIFQKLGYLEIKIQQPFASFLSAHAKAGMSALVIDTRENRVFYGAGQEKLGEEMIERIIEEKQGEVEINGKKMRFYGRYIMPTNHFLAYMTPVSEFHEQMLNLLLHNLVLLLALTVLCLVLSYLSASLFVVNLLNIQQMILSAKSKEDVKSRFNYHEFQAISEAFFQTLRSLEKSNEQLRERENLQMQLERDKAHAELSALEKQLSPHFLNNIFVTIRMLLNMKQIEQADEMLKATSQLFRTSLYQSRSLIQVQEEMEHAGAYFRLQELRLREQVKLEVEPIEDEIRSLWLPKYTLQPLLENAIIHGMKSDAVLHISVSMVRIGPTLEIVVKNDGKKMEEEQIRALNDMLEEEEKASRIGLMNIQKRIRLLFGSAWGVKVYALEEAGIGIMVRLPAMEKPENGTQGEWMNG